MDVGAEWQVLHGRESTGLLGHQITLWCAATLSSVPDVMSDPQMLSSVTTTSVTCLPSGLWTVPPHTCKIGKYEWLGLVVI